MEGEQKLTSNPELKSSVERPWCTLGSQATSSSYRQVGRSVTSDQKQFKGGMTDKEMKMELFILQDDPTFNAMNEKEKMLRLINCASQKLKA